MTDHDMAQVAGILRKRLRAAPPEQYRFTWEMVWELYVDFDIMFSGAEPDFLPEQFRELVFKDYPVELYSGPSVRG